MQQITSRKARDFFLRDLARRLDQCGWSPHQIEAELLILVALITPPEELQRSLAE